jgi:enoyl-CoA hydratase
MDWRYVKIERSGRIAVVRFDRGDNVNALSVDLMIELIDAARSFESDLQTTVVVLSGSSGAFSAGLDLKDQKLLDVLQAPIGERRSLMASGPKMCREWESMEQVTIAAVEGFCIGGGVSLAVACDFRIVGRSAHFRLPELALGLNMSWQTLPRLVHLIGPARTKRMAILANDRISAEQSLDWGLVDEIAEDEESLNCALTLADKIAAMPPIPVKMTKQAVNVAAAALDHATSYMDVDQFSLCQMTEDHGEALAAFSEKRAPSFKGR